MANRTYFVKKNGEIIKELKSLSAAKKIALSENAEVYCGDELVFSPSDGETRTFIRVFRRYLPALTSSTDVDTVSAL